MKRKHSVKPKRRSVVLMLFLLIASIASLAVVAGEWRETIEGVQLVVKGTRMASLQDIEALANVPDTATLASIDLMAIKKRVETNPFVREAIVKREPPEKLEIEIIERSPIAVLLNIHARDWLLDEDGYVIPMVESGAAHDLPVVTGGNFARELLPGIRIGDERLLHALMILKTARRVNTELFDLISEINIDQKNDLILYTIESAVPVIIGSSVDAERKLRSFHAFWNTVAIQHDVGGIEYVDLRYRDEVVVRWRSSADTTHVTTATPDSLSLAIE